MNDVEARQLRRRSGGGTGRGSDSECRGDAMGKTEVVPQLTVALGAIERAAVMAGHRASRVPDALIGNWLRVYVGGEDLDGTISYFDSGSHFVSVDHQFSDGEPEVAVLKALAVASAYRTIKSLAETGGVL